MDQLEIVLGYSELKELIIRKYKIDKNRELVKLYFTAEDNKLVIHDYHDHKKAITLVQNIKRRQLSIFSGHNGRRLVQQSLNYADPVKFLNDEFRLSGFFRF